MRNEGGGAVATGVRSAGMSRLVVGDHVTVVDSESPHVGLQGTIVRVSGKRGRLVLRVGGRDVVFRASALRLSDTRRKPGGRQRTLDHGLRYGEHSQAVQELVVRVCDQEVRLAQKPNEAIGTMIWQSALVLSSHLQMLPYGTLAGKRILELGAGLGLVGITAALLGAKEVCLTDIEEVLPILERNVERNCPANPSNAVVKKHRWGESMENLGAPFDVVVAADVVYIEEYFEPLVWSLAEASTPETKILFAYKSRWQAIEVQFFEILGKRFRWTNIDENLLPPWDRSEGKLFTLELHRRTDAEIAELTAERTKTPPPCPFSAPARGTGPIWP